MSFTVGQSPGPEVKVLSKILPLPQHSVFDCIHILSWNPVHPVVRGFRGAQLKRLEGKRKTKRHFRGWEAEQQHSTHRGGLRGGLIYREGETSCGEHSLVQKRSSRSIANPKAVVLQLGYTSEPSGGWACPTDWWLPSQSVTWRAGGA